MGSSVPVVVVICDAVIAVIGLGFAYLGFLLFKERPEEHRGEAGGRSRFLAATRDGYWFTFFGSALVAVCLLLINLVMATWRMGYGEVAPSEGHFRAAANSDLQSIEMLVATAVLVIVTTWYAWSSHRYAVLLKQQVQLQTDPHVIAYTRPLVGNATRGGNVEIVVANIGKGIARDVSFGPCSDTESQTAWKNFLNACGTSTPMTQTSIGRGIPVLPPNGMVVIEWKLRGFSLRPPLHVLCRCKRMTQGPESDVAPVECVLSATPCEGIQKHTLS